VRRALADAGLPGVLADATPLAPLWELAGMLRAAVLGGRTLDATDLGRPVEEGATGRVPDAAELFARARTAIDALKAAAAAADPLPALAGFGIKPQASIDMLALTTKEQGAASEAMVAAATARVTSAESLLARAATPLPLTAMVEATSQALAAVFGAGFLALPRLLPAPAGEADLWSGALSAGGVKARAGAEIRPWLARAGALRASTAAYGETLLVREAFERKPLLRVVQTPAGAYASWVGLPFPDGKPPMAPLSSMVVEVAGASAGQAEPALDGVVAGVVLDQWTEVVPRRLERSDPKHPEQAPELVDVTTTGVAVNANAPGARPAQAILIALSPDGGRWNAERLVKVLDETLALARMRTLTLQQIPYIGTYLPALYFRDWSLQGEPIVDWIKVATEFNPDLAMSYLKVDQ
jgi:hypothetical protein